MSNKKSPLKQWEAMAISAGVGLISSLLGSGKRKREVASSEAALEEQKKSYMDFEFTNPYAGLIDYTRGMENMMEDLTVNQQQAQFQAQQGAQQRADIMAGLRGAAGASGIAGLAQSLARQQSLEAQRISATIGQQEAMNQKLAAQEASRIQSIQRSAQMQLQKQAAYGELLLEQREFGREETLLAGAYGRAGAARQSQQAHQQGIMDMAGTALGLTGQAYIKSLPSDRKLKRNITLVNKSPSGLNIYNFEYINPKHGEGVHQGVMSDEVPKEAVLNHPDGYEIVNYSLIDVNFKKINTHGV
jgi:hypothetical protein